MGEVDGITFFRKMQAEGFHIPTIFISGHATLSEAARAVKIGGFDFLEKPFSSAELLVAVQRCLEFSQLKERLRLIEERNVTPQIVGDSSLIRSVIAAALKVAATHANVLLTGENGTGKELIASTIHAHSDRASASFVKVNCSAIPEALVESELFGQAATNQRGLFEVAHRGTIFLDEVADLCLPAQGRILRVLQNGEIQKVGAENPMKVDVRVLSGTCKDLKKAVTDGRFSEDLYYRLNVVPIKVPSLRERVEDIPLLVRAFAKKLCEKYNIKEKAIDEDVFWELKKYPWPGNVRELQNVLERVLIMSGDRISTMDLPEEVLGGTDTSGEQGASSALREFRDKTERDFIIHTLRKNNGNVSQSAVQLGVRRTYLHKRLAVLGITKKDFLV
jgi:two-component system nitrogen regulation response regulator NtrX